MTIGNKFIFLYIPKTGSSFTINVFTKINKKLKGVNKFFFQRKKLQTEMVKSKNIKARFYNYEYDQHTTISQIDRGLLKDKKIVSIIRNPYHAYVSRYEYGSYSNTKVLEIKEYQNLAKNNFPNFPDLTFNQFIDFSLLLAKDNLEKHIKIRPKIELGILSLQFIQMFAYDPKEVLRILDFDFFEKGFKAKYFPDILFLNNKNLSDELFDFLQNEGYPKSIISFIKVETKKNVSVSKPYETYLTKESVSKVKELEWFIFNFFSNRNGKW
jgi:hypothetical protein